MDNAKLKQDRWSYSCGDRGINRVRLYEHPTTGRIFAEIYERRSPASAPRAKRVALGHRDRERAITEAQRMALKLREATPVATEQLTLATLFDNYIRETASTKTVSTQFHDRRAAALFQRAFGAGTPARDLSRREWDRFIRDRRIGTLRPKKSKKGRTVRNRAIAYDLQFLQAALNWATLVSNGVGSVLLDRNPLKGLSLPREESPMRVVMTEERYLNLLKSSEQVDPLFSLALVLAHETGHRIGAIRQLRWSDLDLKEGRAIWRGESDKIGMQHVTPLTLGAVAALKARARGIGDAWVFPSPRDPKRPCSSDLVDAWFRRGVAAAELEPIAREGYHSCRRQFASDRMDIPLKVLCALGGWKDPQTILKCYQQADEDAMREGLAHRRPSRSAATQ